MYAIYGNMDPINIPQMLGYVPYMDPMGRGSLSQQVTIQDGEATYMEIEEHWSHQPCKAEMSCHQL